MQVTITQERTAFETGCVTLPNGVPYRSHAVVPDIPCAEYRAKSKCRFFPRISLERLPFPRRVLRSLGRLLTTWDAFFKSGRNPRANRCRRRHAHKRIGPRSMAQSGRINETKRNEKKRYTRQNYNTAAENGKRKERKVKGHGNQGRT